MNIEEVRKIRNALRCCSGTAEYAKTSCTNDSDCTGCPFYEEGKPLCTAPTTELAAEAIEWLLSQIKEVQA